MRRYPNFLPSIQSEKSGRTTWETNPPLLLLSIGLHWLSAHRSSAMGFHLTVKKCSPSFNHSSFQIALNQPAMTLTRLTSLKSDFIKCATFLIRQCRHRSRHPQFKNWEAIVYRSRIYLSGWKKNNYKTIFISFLKLSPQVARSSRRS